MAKDKNTYIRRLLLGLCLPFSLASDTSPCWYVKTSPAILNETVELFCKVDGQLDESTTRKWERDVMILTSKGKSIDSSKFKERKTDDGFALQIIKLQASDLNREYICVYGFKICHFNLTVNQGNFEVHPVNKTVTTTWKEAAGKLEVQIQFPLVYPKPRCNIIYNKKHLAKSIKTKSHHVGDFYSTNVTLEESIGSVCINQLKITCTVGSTDFVIKEYTSPTKKCKNVGKRQVENGNLCVLIALLFGIYYGF